MSKLLQYSFCMVTAPQPCTLWNLRARLPTHETLEPLWNLRARLPTHENPRTISNTE